MNNKGFTLIELVVVLVILGIMSNFVIENTTTLIRRKYVDATSELLDRYTKGIEVYLDTNSVLPTDIMDLSNFIGYGTHRTSVDVWDNPLSLYVKSSVIDLNNYITYGSEKCAVLVVSNGLNGAKEHVYDNVNYTFSKNTDSDDLVFCYPVGLLYNTKYYQTKLLVQELNVRCIDYRNSTTCNGCTPANIEEFLTAGYIYPNLLFDFYGEKVVYSTTYGFYSKGNNKIDDIHSADDILPVTTCF